MAAKKKRPKKEKPQQKQQQRRSWPFVVAVVAFPTLLAVLWQATIKKQAPPGKKIRVRSKWCENIGDNDEIMRTLSSANFTGPWWSKRGPVPSCPFVVRNAVSEEWLSERFWPELLADEENVSYDLKTGNGVFTYFDEKALLNVGRTYDRVESSKQSFLRALNESEGKFARYGGTMNKFSPQVEEKFAFLSEYLPIESGAHPRPLGLWLGGRHSASAPHFDSFHNLHVVMSGPKYVGLWPKPFDIYPATHPSARQSKRDRKTSVEVELAAGDLVFVPAGWVHRFSARDEPVAAVSVTALPDEFYVFGAFVLSPESLPFLKTRKAWTQEDLTFCIREFAKRLVHKLQVKHILEELVYETYDDQTRAYLGLNATLRLPRRYSPENGQCGTSSISPHSGKSEIYKAADDVAAFFTAKFRPALREIYLTPYFENILSKVGGPRFGGVGPLGAINAALDFIQICLLPELS